MLCGLKEFFRGSKETKVAARNEHKDEARLPAPRIQTVARGLPLLVEGRVDIVSVHLQVEEWEESLEESCGEEGCVDGCVECFPMARWCLADCEACSKATSCLDDCRVCDEAREEMKRCQERRWEEAEMKRREVRSWDEAVMKRREEAEMKRREEGEKEEDGFRELRKQIGMGWYIPEPSSAGPWNTVENSVEELGMGLVRPRIPWAGFRHIAEDSQGMAKNGQSIVAEIQMVPTRRPRALWADF